MFYPTPVCFSTQLMYVITQWWRGTDNIKMSEKERTKMQSLRSPDGHGREMCLFAWEQAVEEERNMMWEPIREDKPVQGSVRLLAPHFQRDVRAEVQNND